jgi:microcystin-dependent protein
MANQYLGEIRMFAGNFAPVGWALCNGQLMSISQNAALFAILGTTYGGDGISTFGLPNLMGRVPMHWGQGAGLSSYVIGEMTGTETVTLLQNNLPAHSHPLNANTGGGNQAGPSGNWLAVESTGTSMNYSNTPPNASMANSSIGLTGSNIPINNIQPILCVTFIIALQGIFPSRN